MFPKLKISSFLLKRFEKIKQQSSGCLFGVFYGDHTLLLIGFNIESTIGQLNYKQIQYKFPADIDLCGLVKFGDCSDAEAHLNDIIKDVDITDNPILLNCQLGTLVDLKASIFMHGKLETLPFEIMDEMELYEQFCFSRLRCFLNLYTEENEDALRTNMQKLRKNLAYGNVAFKVKNTKIYFTSEHNDSERATCIKSQNTISDVINAIKQSQQTIGGNCGNGGKQTKSNVNISNKKSAGNTTAKNEKDISEILNQYEIIDIEVLTNRTKNEVNDNKRPPSSFAMHINRDENKISIPLEVDATAILYRCTKLTGLYDILIESICRSLRLIEQGLVVNFGKPEDELHSSLQKPIIYHFLPQEFGHFISVVYLENTAENEPNLRLYRKKLHHHFGLPIIRPYFRRSNKYQFIEDIPKIPLFNVHLGVRPSGVKDGKIYLVNGRYSYYHYMQQNFDDSGWGCAYRSLQTLCSWFNWQGYSDVPVPTHNNIQKYLVKIGDKPNNFTGSRQWIGSTEVGMCLNGFLGVESKILHCNSGGDMKTKGSELAMHFQSQGTPIMIGGGSLAHTILGIDFNHSTGELKFLILDPHYTGEDDIQIIQSKGWCGWKGTDFWDKKSYYNLCMPQRPIIY